VRISAFAVTLVVGLLAGCAAGATPAPSTGSGGGAPAASANPGEVTPDAATVIPTEAAETLAAASLVPAIPADGVTIVYEEGSQFELWSPGGQRVLIDIAHADRLTSPPTASDVLLTTHFHQDHYTREFIAAFPGKALTVEEGTLSAGDVKVRSIAAAHNEGLPIESKGGSDYIFTIDVGGIRVAVFGDLGQDALTADQMEALGTVDVAISQLENSMSDVTAANRRAIAQMNQVHPAILIPTHIDVMAAAKMAGAEWATASTGSWVTIVRDRLPSATTVLFMGDLAAAYRTILGITSPAW
jgi:L-ascorbate metabolism protein UlaG (beta-lactamase superfamily)